MTDVVLGDLVKPIGLKGDLKLREAADFWEGALASQKLQLLLDGARRPVHIASNRSLGRGLRRTSFLEITDRNASESVIGSQLIVELPDEQIEAPPALRPFQVTGFQVHHKDGSFLGTVEDLVHMPAHSVFVVQGAAKHYMIPYVPAIVVAVDQQAQNIVIDPPEGLLDL